MAFGSYNMGLDNGGGGIMEDSFMNCMSGAVWNEPIEEDMEVEEEPIEIEEEEEEEDMEVEEEEEEEDIEVEEQEADKESTLILFVFLK